jgi:hypothetical protein
MSNHWSGRSYRVFHPKDDPPPSFWRLLTHDEPAPEDFASDWERQVTRPKGEDACRYRGVSVWESFEQALDDADEMNKVLAGRLPPFTHVVRIVLEYDAGHACARTGRSEGHHTLWGDSDTLASRCDRVFPIAGVEG